jgi:hypothetical protein
VNVAHLEAPAQRLLVAADMLEELLRSVDNPRAAYLAAALKGDAEAFNDLVQMVIKAKT